MSVAVKIEGVRELTRAIERVNRDLIVELQQTNRELGERIIRAAVPAPLNVGSGAGAVPRPSASRNVLRIMAGGSWRTHVPVQPWGRIQTPRRTTPRPYIWDAGRRQIPVAQRLYLEALFDAARKAGLRVGIG
jgi:hypothetical protein